MVAQEPVKAAIWHSLNSYCFTDAIFLAERLFAEVGTEECLHLLATCYHRAGHTKRTYNLLKKNTHTTIQNKYLYAVVCYTLKKYSEAEIALTGHWTQWNKVLQSIGNEFGSLAGVTMELLGNIYRKSDLNSKAGECFKLSLKYNPFLWGSFEALCQIGEKIDPLDYFKPSNSFKTPTQQFLFKFQSPASVFSPGNNTPQYDSSENLDPSKGFPLLTSTVISKPEHNVNITAKQREDSLDLVMPPPQTIPVRAISKARQRLIGSKVSESPLTPSFGVLATDSPIPVDLGNSPLFITPPVGNFTNGKQMKAPMKIKKSNIKGKDISRKSSLNISSSSIPSTTPSRDSPVSDTENYIVPNLRRSSRLFGTQAAKDNKRTARVHFADVKGGQTATRRAKSRINKTNSTQPLTPTTQNIIQASTKMSQMNIKKSAPVKDEKPITLPSPIQQSTDGLMKLLQEIGKAYHALSLYDCKKAISLFEDLPLHQQETCWVMDKIAISYFELGEMELAERTFEKVREYDSYYIEEGMAIYSSLLWLVRKEALLSCLAQDLVDCDKESAVAWCAMANCFSSQKEHDLAIKFLERAIQLDPEFAYSYTLLGHEYVYTEELEQGLSCFRTALRYNDRHYNAWYGLGMIYYKQEKYQLAEQHYLKALKINPKHSVLLCHLAVAQSDLQKPESALETINRASEINPKNALCKYQKSRILIELDRVQEALIELKELKNLVPKDSNVYYLLGKAYQKLDEPHLAQMNFSWAMTLDPQGSNAMIKDAMNQQRYLNDDVMVNESTTEYEPSESQLQSMQTEDEDDDGVMAIDNTTGLSF